MKLNSLLRWLLRFVCPMVDDPDATIVEPDDPEGDGDDDATGEDDETTLEAEADEAEETDPEPAKTPSRGAKAIVQLRARTQEAERLAREASEEVARLKQATQAKPDVQFADEEAKLRDPNTSDLEKWQINSNRALRQSQQQSHQALFQAQDMADKTAYVSKGIANPVYEKYKDKVEAELTKARAQGQNASRELILEVLVGRDMLNGNFKAKPATKPATVPRGKPTGARSDTPAKGGRSEHQKRAARLENTQI